MAFSLQFQNFSSITRTIFFTGGQNNFGNKIRYFGIRIFSLLIENYGHRTEVRKSLASNQDWIDQYFGKILPMMSGQTNVGLISMNRPGKPDLLHPEGQGMNKY